MKFFVTAPAPGANGSSPERAHLLLSFSAPRCARWNALLEPVAHFSGFVLQPGSLVLGSNDIPLEASAVAVDFPQLAAELVFELWTSWTVSISH